MNKLYFDEVIKFENLYKGLKKSCRNVRWKDSVVGYENNGLKNTLALQEALENGNYEISKYQIFQIHEPKERTIVASRLVDRQFQRSLCDNGLYQDIVEHFIRDNVACQIGKGTDDATNRFKWQLGKFYRKHGRNGWVLKCDIHHFFPSIPHQAAKDAVYKYVEDYGAVQAVYQVIDSFDGEIGIGLGSQISQLVALLVLNDLDHYIKERLHIKCYIRYMDDFVLVHEDKEYLKQCKIKIIQYLQRLGLTLNKKSCIFPLPQGIVFLKWKFVITSKGKVLMLMEKAKVYRQYHRLKKLYHYELLGRYAVGVTKESLDSFIANAQRGNSHTIQKEIINFYCQLMEANK